MRPDDEISGDRKIYNYKMRAVKSEKSTDGKKKEKKEAEAPARDPTMAEILKKVPEGASREAIDLWEKVALTPAQLSDLWAAVNKKQPTLG